MYRLYGIDPDTEHGRILLSVSDDLDELLDCYNPHLEDPTISIWDDEREEWVL